MHRESARKILFFICLVLTTLPWIGPATALSIGVLFSLLLGNPWRQKISDYSKTLLQISVVGLGFGLSIGEVIDTGKTSIVISVVGILFTLLVGYLLGRWFKTERNTSTLISFGTAICGGSAIAAMAPVIKAKNDQTAVALATVFTLNAAALLLFPTIGHLLQLDQATFGAWAGLAIHDTSSVVGAASAYGSQALAVGTTVKLTRAIWIMPFVLGAAWMTRSGQKFNFPYFILGFVAASIVSSSVPQLSDMWETTAKIAKQALVVTLFLIGTGLSREVLRTVGIRPFLQGVSLWLMVGSLTLLVLTSVGLF
ncbi:MAG: putative sulfate exporter family transporter [candidate division Zixibacteria bacterium]|nr:putative sulfate exporter family transporter [candidate division Zixibacteria bacterium]